MSSSARADGLIVPPPPPPNICFSSPFIPGPADVHSSSPALILPRAEHSSPPSKTGCRVPFPAEILLFSFTFSPSVLIFTPSRCAELPPLECTGIFFKNPAEEKMEYCQLLPLSSRFKESKTMFTKPSWTNWSSLNGFPACVLSWSNTLPVDLQSHQSGTETEDSEGIISAFSSVVIWKADSAIFAMSF